MGVYKKAVITDVGRALMARSIAGEVTMQFSRVITSSHTYPPDTSFKEYTSLDGIKQTVIPSNVQVVNDTLISARGLFGNESISESYMIQNIGLYATDGTDEVLFSVSQATTPDEMPAYNGVAPSSFIYTIQATVSQASSLSLTINPAGTATTQDILDLDGTKLDKMGDVSETVIETVETVDTEFPVPEAGESSKTFLGKVKKALQDMKDFSTGVLTLGRLVNNGQTTEPGFALDARYGKTLYDLYAQLNSKIDDKTTFAALSLILMAAPNVSSSINMDELERGIYACYIQSIIHKPSAVVGANGDMGYAFSFNTRPLTSSVSWHGFQIFVDVRRNAIYYRNHNYNFNVYADWKAL